ncbi:epithelial membrane protein 2 [Platysternon megacephalum]|uniref:Epithelial membrane protein 2 n=1 Tax=Platysternon megacephalum TaxID=55544 RepID=A0A4D9DSE3_9SAUR|nr:epithelial membrane protein 2 [Platysternon megacephalum]
MPWVLGPPPFPHLPGVFSEAWLGAPHPTHPVLAARDRAEGRHRSEQSWERAERAEEGGGFHALPPKGSELSPASSLTYAPLLCAGQREGRGTCRAGARRSPTHQGES